MQLVALVFIKSKIMCNLPVLWCLCIRNKSASAGSFPGGKWDDDGFTDLVVKRHPVGISESLNKTEFKFGDGGSSSGGGKYQFLIWKNNRFRVVIHGCSLSKFKKTHF